MSITRCDQCGSTHSWNWTEAFDKFGFDDGDGLVMTGAVVNVLRNAGYTVESTAWGWHNTVVDSITLSDVEQIPDEIRLGYDDPRSYLPAAIITLLDDKLSEGQEVEP